MSDFSLRPRWAFSFQQVMLPNNGPSLSCLRRKVGPGVGRSHLNSVVQLGSSNLPIRYGTHHSRLVAQWFVDLIAYPQLVKRDGQLSSYSNDRSFLGIVSSSLSQLQSPSPQIIVLSKQPQNVAYPLHHQGSQVAISPLLMFSYDWLCPEFLRPGRGLR